MYASIKLYIWKYFKPHSDFRAKFCHDDVAASSNTYVSFIRYLPFFYIHSLLTSTCYCAWADGAEARIKWERNSKTSPLSQLPKIGQYVEFFSMFAHYSINPIQIWYCVKLLSIIIDQNNEDLGVLPSSLQNQILNYGHSIYMVSTDDLNSCREEGSTGLYGSGFSTETLKKKLSSYSFQSPKPACCDSK